MNVNAFWGDDDYDYRPHRRRPSPHHQRSDYRDDFLNPGATSNLYRSRSHGHGPAPVVNVFNRMAQDNDNDNRSRSPYLPYPPSTSSRRASPRASPEFRGRNRLGEDLAEDLVDLALDRRYRSRSRGRSDVSPNSLAEWQLAQKQQELADMERRKQWEREEERIRNDFKLKQMQEELDRDRKEGAAKEHDKRVLADYERKLREEDDKAKERQQIYERKRKDDEDKAKAEEQRIKDKIERDRLEAKAKEEAAEKEFLRRQKEKKEEEEAKYNEFLRVQKEKDDKKKAEEKQKEIDFQNEMRKRLAHLGYTEKTIEIMIDEEKAKKFKDDVEHRAPSADSRMAVFERRDHRAPVYPKVHRDYLAVETLRYYDLPWEYDRNNPEYIIILRDMDKRETDVLFEHTTRLRSKLLLEAPKKQKEYAWVRHRSKSRAGKDRVGILKIERS